MRNAKNGAEFRREVKRRTGIDITFVSGDQEATLIYWGVKQALHSWDDVKLVIDIGGGSVEFIIANSRKILWKQSYKLGAALLLDKFVPNDPLKKSDLSRITAHIDEQLPDLFVAISKYQPQQLIGSAGSFETFASMIRYRFPEAGSHYGKTEHPISIAHFKQLYKELIVSDKAQRSGMKGLIKMRVDMIVMAALILKFVLDKSKIKSMKMSAYSLKEGVVSNIHAIK
ncbi:MAG: exopolyphosphatase [Bacteroidetes bacterium]|nr:exopolyphosphatase [Bacteroidota bacterium]